MLVDILKYIHILLVLTLSGLLLSNVCYQLKAHVDFSTLFVIMSLLLTGGLLVSPKGYTFTTPWINAAFIFSTMLALQSYLSIYIKKNFTALKFKKFILLLKANYTIMIFVFFVIIHDAVTKQVLWQIR